jgi:hypothetical protein
MTTRLFRKTERAAMRKPIALTATILTFVSCLNAAAQTSAPSPTEQEKILIQRILADDGDAIREAGLSKNRLFVRPLKQIYEKTRDRRTKDINQGEFPLDTTVALAQLGERAQMQELWCISINETRYGGRGVPLNVVADVSGWFAFRVLRTFLLPDADVHFFRSQDKEKDRYAIYLPPSYYVFEALARLVPDGPVKPDPNQAEFDTKQRDATTWLEWIDAHNPELMKLEPTGEGVDFSAKACRNGQPRKK